MFLEKSKRLVSNLLDFIPPRIHIGESSSYVDFYIKDPSTGRLRRKKYMLNKFAAGEEQQIMAAQICANIYNQVMRGWNPFVEFPAARMNVLFSTVVNRYESYIRTMVKKGVMTDKTGTDYLSRLTILREFLEDRSAGNMRASEFNATCVTDFLDYVLLDRDASTRTRNNYRTWLSAFCTWMKSRQYLAENFISDIPILAESVKFRDALSPEELRALTAYLEKKDKRFLLACMFEYYTFIRPTELTKITIGDISVKNQTVFVSGAISKSRRDGMVALNDRIIRLMIDLDVFGHPSSDFLFSTHLVPGPKRISSANFRNRFVQLREPLGFPKSYQFYSLKDSGIRDLANEQGIVVAKEQARHTDVSVTNKYLVGKDKKVNEGTKHFNGSM